MSDEPMWDQQDVLDFLNVSRASLYRLRAKDFPAPSKIGGLLRWFPNDVRVWARAQAEPAPTPTPVRRGTLKVTL